MDLRPDQYIPLEYLTLAPNDPDMEEMMEHADKDAKKASIEAEKAAGKPA